MRLRFSLTALTWLSELGVKEDADIQYIAYKQDDKYSIPTDITIYATEEVLHYIGKATSYPYQVGKLEDLDKSEMVEKAMADGATHVGIYKYLDEFKIMGECTTVITK